MSADSEHHDEDREGPTHMPKTGSLRVGCLQKKSISTKGIEWSKRLVMLTEDMILFCKVRVIMMRKYIHVCTDRSQAT